MKTSIIAGVTGQDGAYLARQLLAEGQRVIGGFRRTSASSLWRLDEFSLCDHPHFQLVELDVTDPLGCLAAIDRAEPDYVYNLAAQSFVATSFAQPHATAQITAVGALNLLEAIRQANKRIRFYQASTSELYGKAKSSPQNEETPFHPRSPYAVAKLFAHWTAVNYREAYGIFTATGILFNHESPLRGVEFVTRKVSRAVSRICLGQQSWLQIGNLNGERDWGYAEEYTRGISMMLDYAEPRAFVLATGKATSVRSFIQLAFAAAGIELFWRGQGVDEEGVCQKTSAVRVKVDRNLFRPAEVDCLAGDPTLARSLLGWSAQTSVESLARMMVEADLRRVKLDRPS